MLSRPLTTHFKDLGTYALVLVAASYASLPQFSWGQAASDSLEVWSLMRKAAEKVAPSVVQIETLGGLERVEGNYYAAGPSTGTILSKDGLIVTSAYALLNQPTTILVRFSNGERRAAEKIATDHSRGLVLLQASNVSELPVAKVIPEDQILVGQWAVAVGRTFQPDQINTNVGIVSAKDRVLGKVLQTDAKVSPNNYGGPLVDAQGRVMGVLCAISPRSNEAFAGVDWYDSGIGFAVPMSDIMARLQRWRLPEDLYPGKLGISPASSEQFASPVTVAKVGAKSPAKEAGIEVDDIITSVDGRPIRRFPDLQHALNRRYAGEVVEIILRRGEELYRTQVKLAKTIEPLRLIWMGILPEAQSNEKGVVIKYVFPGSPAELAGLEVGDSIRQIDERDVNNYQEVALTLARFELDESCRLNVERSGTMREVEIRLAALSSDLPEPSSSAEAGEGMVEQFQLEQFPNACDVVIPAGFEPNGTFGMLVWLGIPGQHDQPTLKKEWEQIAAKNRVVIISPHSSEDRRWTPADIEIVNGMIQRALQDYQLDSRKTAVAGEGAGRNLAWRVASDDSRPVQGVGLMGLPVPVNRPLPENQPIKRLLAACWLSETQMQQIEGNDVQAQLTKAGLPTTFLVSEDPQGQPTRDELAAWLMTLDRL